jgi:hypothetical protein
MVKKLELAGYRFAEYPVHHFHRTYGKSQFFNFRRLFKTGVNILRLWWELIILRQAARNIAHQSQDGQERQNMSLAMDESGRKA